MTFLTSISQARASCAPLRFHQGTVRCLGAAIALVGDFMSRRCEIHYLAVRYIVTWLSRRVFGGGDGDGTCGLRATPCRTGGESTVTPRIPKRITKTSIPTSFSSYPPQPERQDYYAHPCQLISLTSVF